LPIDDMPAFLEPRGDIAGDVTIVFDKKYVHGGSLIGPICAARSAKTSLALV